MAAVVDAFVAAYILNRLTGSIGTSASGTKLSATLRL